MTRSANDLSGLTTLGVGGKAEMLVAIEGPQDLADALERARECGLPLLPLGSGSNVVVADAGVRACILRLARGAVEFRLDGDDVIATAAAGCDWDAFVAEAVSRGLQGVECLSGIPGQVGATPIQNVGAYGQEVSETIDHVRALDLSTGRPVDFRPEQCEFGYRDSFFKRRGAGRFLVTRVSFRLRPGRRPELRYGELERRLAGSTPDLNQIRSTVLQLRRAKSMVLAPGDENARSCGSFFVNVTVPIERLGELEAAASAPPPSFPAEAGMAKVPAAWLIEKAGLDRGVRRGSVGLSTKHTLCLVAHEGATASAVVSFAWEIRRRVEDTFGITLIPEPQFWGFDGFDRGLPIQDGV